MRKSVAAVGSSVFFAFAPGVVAGLIPWWLTRWQVGQAAPLWGPVRLAAAVTCHRVGCRSGHGLSPVHRRRKGHARTHRPDRESGDWGAISLCS